MHAHGQRQGLSRAHTSRPSTTLFFSRVERFKSAAVSLLLQIDSIKFLGRQHADSQLHHGLSSHHLAQPLRASHNQWEDNPRGFCGRFGVKRELQ